MKNFILLALLMSTSLGASAQNWVEIPDDNFVEVLTVNFPECMDGNQLDTQCPDVVNATHLHLSWRGLTDLTGVEYFINLEVLNCSVNELTTLPELPATLKELLCYENDLTELPTLPDSLEILRCQLNQLVELRELPSTLTYLGCHLNNLTELPTLPPLLTHLSCFGNYLVELPELPNSLEHLNCRGNQLTELPELPTSLLNLYCEYNNITALPALPTQLNHLWCHWNPLNELPPLPASLIHLRCGNTNITTLPELPSSFEWLQCENNNLGALPILPNSLTNLECSATSLIELPNLPSTLTYLDCGENNLSTLPELPNTLERLFCANNNLTALPELPTTLINLSCQNNQISCLPILPSSILPSNPVYDFNISGNLFTCLPNYIPAMTGPNNGQWLSYPLCDLSDLEDNPFGCNSFEGIAGTVFEDSDADCEQGENENGLVNLPVQLLDDQGNQLSITHTVESKLYGFSPGAGTYTVRPMTDGKPYQSSCIDPGDEQVVALTEAEPTAFDVDFGIECRPGYDIGIQSVTKSGWVFPGQIHDVKITAGDLSDWYGLDCSHGLSGSVTVNITGPVSFSAPAYNALTPSVSGGTQLTYSIGDFGQIDFENSFSFHLITDTSAQTGELVCIEVLASPLDYDANPENNAYTHCYEITNSYDPNIKEVWPQTVEPGYDDYFSYTIRFQNTGTAPAFNIRLADTLDTNLDLSTFEVIGYSHPCLTYVAGNVATFRFNNIMLPDSTNDLEGSNGYVQYRIKPVADLPVGTVIENTAHIYFDFNDAIVTNTTLNEFAINTSVKHPQEQIAQVFPNPSNGQFNVLFCGSNSGVAAQLEVYKLNGQRILKEQVNENHALLDLTDYPSGIYVLHVRNERGSEAVRLVKQ